MSKVYWGGLAVGLIATGALGAGPATAATPTFDRLVAYVRAGNVYVSKGATERRLTDGGGHARPRWSPDGKRLAYLRAGQLWVMNGDGTGKRRLTTRPAAGPSWSPDGKWIAFGSATCIGGPGVYRISTTAAAPAPQVLFPASCRGEALPPVSAAGATPAGTLTERLRLDDAVAWSPDGTRIAFRGGDCESIYDDCLSLGTVATGGERVLAAYGGGGLERSGFAVVPGFRPDGARLTWTAYLDGGTVHVVEYDPATAKSRRLGAAEDRELAYVNGSSALLTGRYKGGSWVLAINLASGARTPFHPGSQPDVQ
jgi:TolB protein